MERKSNVVYQSQRERERERADEGVNDSDMRFRGQTKNIASRRCPDRQLRSGQGGLVCPRRMNRCGDTKLSVVEEGRHQPCLHPHPHPHLHHACTMGKGGGGGVQRGFLVNTWTTFEKGGEV